MAWLGYPVCCKDSVAAGGFARRANRYRRRANGRGESGVMPVVAMAPFAMSEHGEHGRKRKGDRQRRDEKRREPVPRSARVEGCEACIHEQRRSKGCGQRRARRVTKHELGGNADEHGHHDEDGERLQGFRLRSWRVTVRTSILLRRRPNVTGGSAARYASSFLSSVIAARSTLETGQPAFAFSAAVSNACWLAPGIFAVRSRCTAVIANPPPVFSSVTVAVCGCFARRGPLAELRGQRHREASGVRGGDQFLGVGPVAVLEPGAE